MPEINQTLPYGSEAITQQVSLDGVLLASHEYAAQCTALVVPEYITEMHERGRRDSMDEEAWAKWKTEFPLPDPKELETLRRERQAKKNELLALFPDNATVYKERLLMACLALVEDPFSVDQKADVQNPAHVPESSVDFENDWYSTLDGLITLAELTGQAFSLHNGQYGDYDEYSYFTVTARTPRPQIRERYNPDHWPEMHEIHYDLDRYVREFYPEQYTAKDPALLEKYQDILDRIQANHKQPIVTITVSEDSVKLDMGLATDTELQVKYGGAPDRLVGDITIKAFATQWVFVDKQDPSKFIPEMSKPWAEYCEGLLVAERLWTQDGRLANPHHEDIILLIGNREIEDYIAGNPAYATAIDSMISTYRTPELFNVKVASLPQVDSPLLYVDDETRARFI